MPDNTSNPATVFEQGKRLQLAETLLHVSRTVSTMETLDEVLYCHAAPGDDLPITTIFTPDETLLERFGSGTAVIGHTHHQFDRRLGDLRVVNAGSLGMPYEGEVAAFWALLVDGEPQFRSTPFDVERAIREIEASGWPTGPEFVAENLRSAVRREEAAAQLEGG